MGWFNDVRAGCENGKAARGLYDQCKVRIKDIQSEIAVIEAKLETARMVVNHHRLRRGGGGPEYHLADGSIISTQERQSRQSRLRGLQCVLPDLQTQREEYERDWRQCARDLRELVIQPILRSPGLTNDQERELKKEIDRDDVIVHVSPNRPTIHVYFGDPDNDEEHGHCIIHDSQRVEYRRLRGEPRGKHNDVDMALGMARVRAGYGWPAPLSTTSLFFNKPAALVVPQVGVDTFLL